MLVSLLLIAQITYTPNQKFWQVVSDVSVGVAQGFDARESFKSTNKAKAFGCEGLRDGIVGVSGWLSQKWIHSPRPDGSGNGMPSLHSLFTGVGFKSTNFWLSSGLMSLTAIGRHEGGRHTWSQIGVGLGGGIGASFIRCGL
jgi:hypothetical protein